MTATITEQAGGAVTVAYVLGRVSQAMTGASGDIEYMRGFVPSTLSGAPGRPGLHVDEWSYRERRRTVTTTASGRILAETVYAQHKAKPGTPRRLAPNAWMATETDVSYAYRQWASGPALATGPFRLHPATCAQWTIAIPSDQMNNGAAVAAQLRKLMSCGIFRLAGRHEVDGVNAIELTTGPPTGRPPAGPQPADPPWVTFWIDPRTYLPVREVDVLPLGRTQTDYAYLPPTPANLGLLDARVPTGFRHVSCSAAGVSIQASFGNRKSPSLSPFCSGGVN